GSGIVTAIPSTLLSIALWMRFAWLPDDGSDEYFRSTLSFAAAAFAPFWMMSQNVSPGAPCVTIAIVIRGVSAFPAPIFALPSSAFLPPPLLHAPAITARLTTSAAPRSRLPDLNISLPFFQEFLIDCGCRPVGVRHRRRPATVEHVADAASCLGEGRSSGSSG